MSDDMCSVCSNDAEYRLGCEIYDIGNKEEKTVFGYYCLKCLPDALERFVHKAKDLAELI